MHTYQSILVGLSASLLLIYGCAPSRPSGAVIPTLGDHLTPSLPPSTAQILPSNTLEPRQTSTPTLELPTPTPQVPVEKVTFSTADGIQIAGTLFGEGDLTILMLHMGKGKATANDQADWHPRLAEAGYPSLAINFHGMGESGGDFENDPVILDAQAALDFLHQRGYSRYICLGDDLGGTTCMVMALSEPPATLIVLSSTLSVGPINALMEKDFSPLIHAQILHIRGKGRFRFSRSHAKHLSSC